LRLFLYISGCASFKKKSGKGTTAVGGGGDDDDENDDADDDSSSCSASFVCDPADGSIAPVLFTVGGECCAFAVVVVILMALLNKLVGTGTTCVSSAVSELFCVEESSTAHNKIIVFSAGVNGGLILKTSI